MSFRTFFSNVGLMVLLNLLIKPIYMLIETAVQNKIGHEAYGDYAAALSFAFIGVWLSDFGISQYTTRMVAEDSSSLKEKMPFLLSIKLTLSAIYPFIIGVCAFIYYSFTLKSTLYLSTTEMIFLTFLAGAIMGSTKLMEFFRNIFQGLQEFKIDSFASVLERLLLVVGTSILLYTSISLYSFVYLRLLCLLACCGIFYIILSKISHFHYPKWDYQEAKQIFKQSFPFAMIMFLYSANDKIDQLLLQSLRGSEETGLYAAAYRFLDASANYLWIILPMFFARFAFFKNNRQEKEKLLHIGQVITALPLIFLSLFVFYYGGKLLFLFKGSTGEEIITILVCLKTLFYSSFVGGLFAIFSTLLTATGHEKFVNRIVFAGIAINIISNLIFIPIYGCEAAAWNTLINNLFLCICEIIYIQFKTDIKVPYLQTLKLLVLAALSWITFYFLSDKFHWVVVTSIAGVLYIIYTFLLGVLPNPKMLMALLKKKPE